MRYLDTSCESIKRVEARGRDPFHLCRFVVPGLLLLGCIAAGAAALTDFDGAYYLSTYWDLTPLATRSVTVSRLSATDL